MMRFAIVSIFAATICFAADVSSTAASVTFHKDVESILQKNCQSCHRPGQIAPMSFLSYDSVRPWAKAIKNAVASKKMPPWFADEGKHAFSNQRKLTQAEIETLSAWADGGAPEGNPKDAPAPRVFTDLEVAKRFLEDFGLSAAGSDAQGRDAFETLNGARLSVAGVDHPSLPAAFVTP